MKKLFIILLTLCLTTFIFAQETDSDYWYRESDIGGKLVTEYVCKTDAQFNNAFKKIVKEQLELKYDFYEPNWNLIKNSFISLEGIKKNFPNVYSYIKDDMAMSSLDSDYKYYWCIQDLGGVYVIKLFKRVNGIVYRSLTTMDTNHQWAYTQELLTVLERNFN